MLSTSAIILIVCFLTGLLHPSLALSARNNSETQAAFSWQNLEASLNTSSKGTNGTNDLTFTLKFLVFPQVPEKVADIHNALHAYVGSGSVERFESHLRPDFDGVEFWIVHAAVAKIVAITRLFGNDARVVRSTSRFIPQGNFVLNTTETESSSIRHQQAPSWDLSYVSWAPGVPLADVQSYAFEEKASSEIYIYMIENGLDPSHVEFSHKQNPPIGWFFPPWAQNKKTDDAISEWTSHGTCVASKAVGLNYGVSKNSNLIVLKAAYTIEDIIWALVSAHKNILANNRQRRAVISLALAADASTQGDPEMQRVKEIIGELFKIDAIIVVPSGNYGYDASRVSTVPGIWERGDFPLIVVGGIAQGGLASSLSQGGNHVATYAPGESVLCANKDDGHGLITGTSAASGMVTGLVAYFLGLSTVPFAVGQGRTAYNAKSYLRISPQAGWHRVPNGVRVIWNGIDSTLLSLNSNVSTS